MRSLREIDGVTYGIDVYGTFREIFTRAHDTGSCRVIVAHEPDNPRSLVASGAAWIHQIMPAAWLPNGKLGYLQWFYTKPAWRGRGTAQLIGEELIAWLNEAGCTHIQLHAVAEATPLYRRLGFKPTIRENLWLGVPD